MDYNFDKKLNKIQVKTSIKSKNGCSIFDLTSSTAHRTNGERKPLHHTLYIKPHLHGSSGLFPPSTPEKQRKEICCQWQLVGVTGLEPVQYFYPQILSLLSMPIRLYPHMAGVVWIEHTMQESKSCALTAWLHSYINPAALQAALAYLHGC